MRGHGPELRHSLRKAQDAWRLRRLKKKNQADELVPALQLRHRDRVKVSHPRRKNAAKAEAKPASDR